jgi:hypothetical protein
LNEKFLCVVCFFAEFFVLENVHSNCEFCDSTLILSRLSVFEFVVSLVVSSTLENLSSENQSFVSFSSMRKEESKVEKKVVFISCSSACFFLASSVESLLAFVFFVSESVEWSSAVQSSRRSEIVQKKKIEFFDEKIVIKNEVSNLCETSNSSLSSLNKSCVEVVEIEEKEKEKKKRFCFEFFVIDFVLSDFRVDRIKNLWSVVSIIDKNRKYQKNKIKKKKKKECFSKRLISIEKIDQSRMKMMRVWLKKFLKKKNVKINISRKRSSVCHEEARANQIFDDDIIFTSFANVVSLIDHYARVRNSRSVSFRRLQYYEIFKSIRRLMSRLWSRKKRKNSSFVSILWFD